MTRFKGPVFPSFKNPGRGDGTHKVWPPGYHGMAQRLRNLRARVRPILDSRDPEVCVCVARLLAAVQSEPNPEFSMLHLAGAAIDAADARQQSWTDAMTFILDEYDRRAVDEPPMELDAAGRPLLVCLPDEEAHGPSS